MSKPFKVETTAEYLARGGEIKRLPAKGTKAKHPKANKESKEPCIESINIDSLPKHVKISLGLE